jgi:hypothetical protein
MRNEYKLLVISLRKSYINASVLDTRMSSNYDHLLTVSPQKAWRGCFHVFLLPFPALLEIY